MAAQARRKVWGGLTGIGSFCRLGSGSAASALSEELEPGDGISPCDMCPARFSNDSSSALSWKRSVRNGADRRV